MLAGDIAKVGFWAWRTVSYINKPLSLGVNKLVFLCHGCFLDYIYFVIFIFYFIFIIVKNRGIFVTYYFYAKNTIDFHEPCEG